MELLVSFIFFAIVYIGMIVVGPMYYPHIKEQKFEFICLYGIIVFVIAEIVSTIAVTQIFGG